MCVCRLEILYLGGNRLTSLPVELGRVTSLVSLVVSDNQLSALPRSLTKLSRLQSLSLHNNRLATLPPDIIRLPLVELSLRNNPLVVKFVEELIYDAPSLLELAGRCVKLNNIQYSLENIPASLVRYLDSAQCCVNPRCNGASSIALHCDSRHHHHHHHHHQRLRVIRMTNQTASSTLVCRRHERACVRRNETSRRLYYVVYATGWSAIIS